jgi:hypothetical protein
MEERQQGGLALPPALATLPPPRCCPPPQALVYEAVLRIMYPENVNGKRE